MDIARGVVLPFAVVIAGVTLISTLAAALMWKTRARLFVPLILMFASLGGTLGIFVGASQTPVVGDLLPALLTFVSGLLAYVVTKKDSPVSGWRRAMPFCIVALLFAALTTSFLGSSIRGDKEERDKRYNEWLLEFEKVDLEVDKARLIKLVEQHPDVEIKRKTLPRR